MLSVSARASAVLARTLALREQVLAEGKELLLAWGAPSSPDDVAESLENMARYVALRCQDVRQLQHDLVPFGLSSLGRLEGHVLASLDAVCRSLALIAGDESRTVPEYPPPGEFERDEFALRWRAEQLFALADESNAAIMVTLEPQSARSPEAVCELIDAGATSFRINLAHGAPDDWTAMISNVRAAQKRHGRRCTIVADLGGPKIRIVEARTLPEAGRVFAGAKLLLVERDPAPSEEFPFQLTASVAGLTGDLDPGIHVLIDDGHIETVVAGRIPQGVVLEVLRTRRKGEKLKPEKGLNAPDVPLGLDCLTAKDLEDLGTVAPLVDNVGLSFVRGPHDICRLQEELRVHCPGGRMPGIIAKIELQAAFAHLPEIIVKGSRGPFAVMIARGDLAVAVGFERMVEVQEEMLWLCQSARAPVIWATQVLEGLTKDGVRSRAEVTDAAMASRAECVMLNKGPHVVEAVRALADILSRMSGHQHKKSARLRALAAWAGSGGPPKPPARAEF